MNWLTRLFRRRDLYYDLAEEMREHLEEKTEQFMRAGLPREEAEHAARRAFGNATLIEEHGREVWQWPRLESIWTDAKFALRQFGKSPGFTVTAILTLALGIGFNAAIFGLLQAVLLRPLPYLNPDQLVRVTQYAPRTAEETIPEATYLTWRQHNRAFAGMAAFDDHRCDGNIAFGSQPRRLDRCAVVSANFFSLLGIQPALGREFLTGEDSPAKARTMVLGHSFWQEHFGADPHVIGRSLTLDGETYTVIGVLPSGYLHPGSLQPDAFVPMIFPNGFDQELRGDQSVSVIGRLQQPFTPAQAASDLLPVSAAVQRLMPDPLRRQLSGAVVRVTPIHEALAGNARPALLVLSGATALVLLIACANVASLLLVRSVNRQRELALRRTLGAGGLRLARQLLTEGILLSSLGGAAGVFVAFGVVRLVGILRPADLPLAGSFQLNGSLVLLAFGLAATSGILVSLAPAVFSYRLPLGVSLNAETARVTPGAGSERLRSLFVTSEIALALILLVGAGLLLRSLGHLLAVDPGFEPRHALTVQVTLTQSRYPTKEARRNFFEQLLAKIQTLPGVKYAGGTTDLPFYYDFSTHSDVTIQGSAAANAEPVPFIPVSAVSPGYFRAMGIPLVTGRFFTDQDRGGSEPVVIVNKRFAEQYLRGTQATGTTLRFQPGQEQPARDFTLVGIVGDTRFAGLDSTVIPEVMVPFLEFPDSAITLAVRTGNEPQTLVPAIRRAVQSLDKDQPIYHIATMQERVDSSNSPRRFDAWLLGIFAALALGLAAVGLYGVMSHAVANRTREIGIRIALGANPLDVVWLVLGQGTRLALVGIAFGLAGSLALAGLLRSLIFGIAPTDPVTYTGAAIFLTAVALVACGLPAIRAASIDPMKALRAE
ncbi:MAG TPA: ABC transporter permease [Silvibacterium sp.]|nr:ABC transporter permease [Silvibacterium sp.]